MIKDNQRYFNRLHVVIDAVVICIAYVLAWIYKFLILKDQRGLTLAQYCVALIGIIPLYLMLYLACNLYTSKRVQGRRLEGGNIVKANTIGILIVMAAFFPLRDVIEPIKYYSRWMLAYFYVINIVLEIIARNLIRWCLRKIRRKGFNLRHLIFVGYSGAAEAFIDRILANPQWGYKISGILDDNKEPGYTYKGIAVLGSTDELEKILENNRLDEIALTLALREYYKLKRIVAICEKSGVHTKFVPDYNDIIPTRPYTEDLLGLPVVNIRHVPLTNSFNMICKRAMDIVGAIVAIIIFSPVMLVTAVLVKTTSKGPLIYKQERVGLHNQTFQMYKFRSMEVQSAKSEKRAWTVRDDPRVTKVGRVIRKTSIDELPQLFNILKGDMSLVGPRPERPFFVEKFREEIPRYMVKHQVRPGLTGWAQVNGYRGDTSIKKRIEYDLYYIENWTMGLDIKILFLTFFKGFVNKNAY
ncbi:undecaprenyl-phosphate glucose phosphotransferase [Hominiventricola aquisgranensis]|uniref:Undecaprenyl-phosphate glucose phosphotransferase n=1 Tax=Hominiventricola aquisgranensis TaxID=3133164 RepID=A0ABV1HXL3_9FIRM|nr:undecaprenyl-phosphate glucose phosphotransferase [Clostridiaceae bacterium AF31-3BH]RHQ27090.1 undecaprenyl-phosphate glucose phosphotransferase [Clostridiaceae bacterium AF29-16BH]RHR44502.1 undecaprenyl-phosphate glucose phosphotransferase [Clostridiaceae bacterium AF18-31LB]